MNYKVTIGLEIHASINTKTKVFSGAENKYNIFSNENVRPLDLAFPGAMPFLNEEALKKSIKTALALNCKIANYLAFDRKNYYYADLPKGYQITQIRKPVGENGKINIYVDNKEKEILIHDLHLEEDTASLDHYDDYSLIDYNRAGVPLMEIVTEPCIETPNEAVRFLEELKRIFYYCDVSEADMKKGQMRCDVNISLRRKENDEYGTRVEIKNIGSFANVKEALIYEIDRQSKLLDQNKDAEIIMETRRYNEDNKKTIKMRSKTEALDYKYMPEANIPYIKISDEYVEKIKEGIPKLAFDRQKEYIEKYNIKKNDAKILVKEKEISDFFEEVIKDNNINYQQVANVINTKILSYINKENTNIKEINLKPKELRALVKALEENLISSKQVKDMLKEVLENNKNLMKLLNDDDNKQITSPKEILKLLNEAIKENEEKMEKFSDRKDKLIEFLIGQIMKKSKGRANPLMTRKIVTKEIN